MTDNKFEEKIEYIDKIEQNLRSSIIESLPNTDLIHLDYAIIANSHNDTGPLYKILKKIPRGEDKNNCYKWARRLQVNPWKKTKRIVSIASVIGGVAL